MRDKKWINKLDSYWPYFLLFALVCYLFVSKMWDDKTLKKKGLITVTESEDNPRDRLETDTLYYNDSVFVVKTIVDTIYKKPVNVSVIPRDNGEPYP